MFFQEVSEVCSGCLYRHNSGFENPQTYDWWVFVSDINHQVNETKHGEGDRGITFKNSSCRRRPTQIGVAFKLVRTGNHGWDAPPRFCEAENHMVVQQELTFEALGVTVRSIHVRGSQNSTCDWFFVWFWCCVREDEASTRGAILMGGGFCNRMLFSQHPWCIWFTWKNCTKDPWLSKAWRMCGPPRCQQQIVRRKRWGFSKEIEVPKSGSKSVGKWPPNFQNW